MIVYYEGRCDFCKRDIGAGHEKGCPYYPDWAEAVRRMKEAKRAARRKGKGKK